MRVEWDTTISELVETSLRAVSRIKALRRSHRNTIIVSSIFIMIILSVITYLGFAYFDAAPQSRTKRMIIALLAGLIAAAIYPWFYWDQVKYKLRLYYRETHGRGKHRVIVELSPEGVIVSQTGTHVLFTWANIKEINHATDSIDSIDIITLKGTLVVINKSAFSSDLECMKFYDSALALWESHRTVSDESKDDGEERTHF